MAIVPFPNLDPSAATFGMDSDNLSHRSRKGYVYTVGRNVHPWVAIVSFPDRHNKNSNVEKAMLEAFLAEMRGEENRCYLPPSAYAKRGSFGSTELLSNPTFANGTTGWTASGELTLTASERILRALRTAVTGDQTIRAAAAVTVNGVSYAARLLARAGRGPMDYRLRLGTSAGGSELAADGADYTSGGLRTLVAAATGTATHFSVLDGNTGRSAGHFMEFAYASLARVPLVQGASQSGAALLIDQLPLSTNGLLLPGDMAEVILPSGSSLHKTVASLNSDGSGVGYWMFTPPLIESPADNAAVIIHNPMAKWRLVNTRQVWSNKPGSFSDFELEFEQDLTP